MAYVDPSLPSFLPFLLFALFFLLRCLCLDQMDHGHRGDRLGERQPLPLLRQPSVALAGQLYAY